MANTPRSPDSIRQEISELERRRDVMLRNAPKHVLARRLILPIVFVPVALGLTARLTHGHTPPGGVLVMLVVCLMAGAALWKAWRPGYDPRDLWAASDGVGYEGESPREVQRRIDALQARLAPEDGDA
jgi:hypothetical protein